MQVFHQDILVNCANLEECVHKSKPGRVTEAPTVGDFAMVCAGSPRFEERNLRVADVVYMSQIGDIFDIVQQSAKSTL
jgi:hypothetical protein